MKLHILSAILFFIPFTAISQTDKFHSAFVEDFADSTSNYFKYGSTGNKTAFKYKFGVNSLTEAGTNVLSFKIDPQDSAGAGRGPEIISKCFTHFGTYAARLKVPQVKDIQPNVGAVVGYFTYHVDSIPGLSEIDFEWLPADPTIIYVGTWTGHAGELKRVGRTINLAKGIIYNTVYKENHTGLRTPLTGMQNQPDTIAAIADYDASTQFYTYGFDWYADRIRWWMIHPTSGEKIVLWDYQGSARGIPQHPTLYRMNFWHTNAWPVETNALSIEKPLHPYELEVDWMSYEPFKSGSK
ncbi:glycoside hydrolase family 16 protein [Catalinimonas niigatensis]|uniref:glycoside hydrolase family 16 protein n=1 Tax=Catalinimonas niigatensis TaxID=1397264 RepID=UPI002665C125|nr:glycoside hydrolase family 16 protein [Catalinimonas niigatensis]WPP49755.1 glycoside hydrolase family 16 protein [Catalinimonas niigatensis]